MRRCCSSWATAGAMLEALEPRRLLSAGGAVGEAGLIEAVTSVREAMEGLPVASVLARPLSRVMPLSTGRSPKGYTPKQMSRAYGLNQLVATGGPADGAGQTIAVVSAFNHPRAGKDLAVFSRRFGLPAMNRGGSSPRFSQINLGAGQSRANAAWALETSLDVQWAHAIAPRANIVLVEARSPRMDHMLAAVREAAAQPQVTVVSMSWGSGEFYGQWRYDRTFTTPRRHRGVTFVAASGDDGAPALWPATSNKVLAVGGTTLKLDAKGNYVAESGWLGSGGGASLFVKAPGYQAGLLSEGFRSTPDVAYNADMKTGVPVYTSVPQKGRTGWFQVGGTSSGAPQWAAIIAIANQQRAAAGKASLDGPSQVLPTLYTLPAGSFHDVVAGSSGGSPLQHAAHGYDAVTGLGSPVGNRVVEGLLKPRSLFSKAAQAPRQAA